MAKYFLVASSRTRTTEVYRSASGKLVQRYAFKSGAIEYSPLAAIPDNLTIRYQDSTEFIEGPDEPVYEVAPALVMGE